MHLKINCFGNILQTHYMYHFVHEMGNTHWSCCMVAISRCVFRGKFSMPNIHPMFPFWFLLVPPGEKSAKGLQSCNIFTQKYLMKFKIIFSPYSQQNFFYKLSFFSLYLNETRNKQELIVSMQCLSPTWVKIAQTSES